MDKNRLFELTKISKTRNIAIIIVVLVVYIFQNFGPDFIINEPSFIYIFKPILWCLIIFMVLCLPKPLTKGKMRLRSFLLWMTILLAGCYLLIMMLVGLAVGFGRSPFDHSISGLFINIIKIFSFLVASELIRNYLINNFNGKGKLKYFLFITIFLTVINLPLSQIWTLKTNLDIVTYIGKEVLVKLCKNAFATYLVFMGGPLLSIIYLGLLEGFYWFSPILPNLNWITEAFIGTLCPIFSMLFFHFSYNSEIKASKTSDGKAENPIGWFITSAVSILIVWFAIGVFPVRPFVIATGSMEPVIYAGDMVMVERIDTKDLKVGDIIQFKSDEVFIFHRIIEIKKEKRETMYRTKGDNNSAEDNELVKPENIKGRVVFTVPKIGYPTLLFKKSDDSVKKKYQF